MHEELWVIEAPGTLGGTRIPSVIVPVCVAKGVGARACVRATACVTETPCVEETPCVSGVVTSVPGCVLPSTPCEEEAPRVKEVVCVSETV